MLMWFAHVTVANIVLDQDRFLIVEEQKGGQLVLNQPAGHLEDKETLLEAVVRETLEETQWMTKPTASLGISRYITPNGETYIRHSFISDLVEFRESFKRDEDITDVHWMTLEQLKNNVSRLRSPLVLRDIERYYDGLRIELEDLYHF